MWRLTTFQSVPTYHVETPCLFISPLTYMGMHPVISHKFVEYKQNPVNLQVIFKLNTVNLCMQIKVRGGYRTKGVFENVTPNLLLFCERLTQANS